MYADVVDVVVSTAKLLSLLVEVVVSTEELPNFFLSKVRKTVVKQGTYCTGRLENVTGLYLRGW